MAQSFPVRDPCWTRRVQQLTATSGMWFQFAPDKEDPTECDPKKKMRSQLFYGMPALPWGPPNVVRIAVDAARRRIPDPEERESNVFNPKDIRDTQEFVRNHTVGIDASVPASTISCLQTNVFGKNPFVGYRIS